MTIVSGHLTRITLCLALAAHLQVTASASTTIYAIDPQAHTVLNQMQATYSAMTSLSEQVESRESASLTDPIVLHTSLQILRPGYLLMKSDSKSSRSGSNTVVTDGTHCFVTAPEYPARYLKFTVPSSEKALETATSEGITSGFTLDLFSDPEAIGKMFPDRNLATLVLAGRAKVEGHLCDIVVVTDTNGASLTFHIGHSDHLVRKIVVIDPDKSGVFTETYSSIEVNVPLKPANFTFVPPVNTAPFYGSSFSQAVQNPPN